MTISNPTTTEGLRKIRQDSDPFIAAADDFLTLRGDDRRYAADRILSNLTPEDARQLIHDLRAAYERAEQRAHINERINREIGIFS